MKISVRLAQPKTEKERLYHAEAELDDLRNPAQGWIVIGGKEYLIEVHC